MRPERSPLIVFFCRCFGEIGGAVDLDRLAGRVAADRPTAALEIRESLCLPGDLEEIGSRIAAAGAGRVLVAACSWRARGAQVVEGLARRGLHPADIELVDLREGCAWIHLQKAGETLEKAMNLVDMGLAALDFKGGTPGAQVGVRPAALVIGAGPAGLSAAASLGKLGIPVHVIDRKAEIGGMLTVISRLYPEDQDPDETLLPLRQTLSADPKIEISTKTTVASVAGAPGSFEILLSGPDGERGISVGAVVVAAGARPLVPEGHYRYGRLQNVISQMELERRLAKGALNAKRVVFIQCVGARSLERPYCATVCCPLSLKNAMRLINQDPEAACAVLYRDMVVQGPGMEAYYRRAMSAGVKFVRFDARNPPQVEGKERVEAVSVFDVLSGKEMRLEADAVVLSTPLTPHPENRDLARMLGVRLDPHGFFSGAEPMHPLASPVDGVFFCGSARWPVSAQRAASQGRAAAAKVFGFLSGGRETPAFGHVPKAGVGEDACSGCGNCVDVCPFQACSLRKAEQGFKSAVDPARCKGCGTCTAACLNGAIQVPENNARKTREMIKVAFSESRHPRIMVFACKWCGFIGADGAGRQRLPLTPNFRMIVVECAAGIGPEVIVRALADGVDGVAVFGCHHGGCRHHAANRMAARRLELLEDLLEIAGMDRRRLLVEWGTAHEGFQFENTIHGFQRDLNRLLYARTPAFGAARE